MILKLKLGLSIRTAISFVQEREKSFSYNNSKVEIINDSDLYFKIFCTLLKDMRFNSQCVSHKFSFRLFLPDQD